MRSISDILPGLPGLPAPPSRAPWPIWRGSVTSRVRFTPLSRKQAARIWHAARRWESQTHRPGRHGGVIGRTALLVLYALLFDFLNHDTGRLDPSHRKIAARVGCSPRAVADALKRLRDLGILAWVRRCVEDRDEQGRFRLRQRSNAYTVLLPSRWFGYREPPPVPPPEPGTWGDHPPLPDAMAMAAAELKAGNRRGMLAALEVDPNNALALAFAGWMRLLDEREARRSSELQQPQ